MTATVRGIFVCIFPSIYIVVVVKSRFTRIEVTAQIRERSDKSANLGKHARSNYGKQFPRLGKELYGVVWQEDAFPNPAAKVPTSFCKVDKCSSERTSSFVAEFLHTSL